MHLTAIKKINSYYTAPSTYSNQKYGYVFDHCRLTGNCPDRTVMLSRPWRIHAKAVFLNCEMSGQITETGFSGLEQKESHDTCYYAEYNCHGEGIRSTKEDRHMSISLLKLKLKNIQWKSS